MKKQILCLLLALVFVLALVGCSKEKASEPAAPVENKNEAFVWSADTITIITDQAAGTAGDALTRKYAELFAKYSGKTVLVENITEGNGLMAAAEMMNKEAGTVFLQFSSSIALVIAGNETAYTPESFMPIDTISKDVFWLSVNAKSEFKNLKDLVEYSKAHPEELNGAGNMSKGVTEYFGRMASKVTGLSFTYVPYASANDSKIGVIGGDSDILFLSRNLSAPEFTGGNILPLATTSESADPEYDVPTFASLGYPEMNDVSFWRGLFAKAGTDQRIIDAFLEVHAKVVEDEAWLDILKKQNIQKYNIGQAAFTTLFKETYDNGLAMFGK